MINIRAGIVKNLRIEDVNQIYENVIKELICKNGIKDIVEKYIIITIMEKNNLFCEHSLAIDDIEDVFGNSSKTLLKYLQAKYTIGQIKSAIYMFMEISHNYNNSLNIWKNVNMNIGIQKEYYAKNELSKIGIKIVDVKSQCKDFYHENLCIKLYGKPDGMILDSIGKIYNDNTLIEIKYKKYQSNYSSDIYQLVAYGMIFSCDVLYVVVLENNFIELKLYNYKNLETIWNSISERIFLNCKYFHELFSTVHIKEESLQKLVSMISIEAN
jgi:hypothetical protein